MTCKNCGKDILEEDTFCIYCGEPCGKHTRTSLEEPEMEATAWEEEGQPPEIRREDFLPEEAYLTAEPEEYGQDEPAVPEETVLAEGVERQPARLPCKTGVWDHKLGVYLGIFCVAAVVFALVLLFSGKAAAEKINAVSFEALLETAQDGIETEEPAVP